MFTTKVHENKKQQIGETEQEEKRMGQDGEVPGRAEEIQRDRDR